MHGMLGIYGFNHNFKKFSQGNCGGKNYQMRQEKQFINGIQPIFVYIPISKRNSLKKFINMAKKKWRKM